MHQSSKVGGSISTETSQRHKSQRGGISAMWFDPALDSASSLQPRDAADSGDSTEDDEPDEAGDEYSGKSINLEVQVCC